MFVIWWWALLDKALWEHIGIKYQWCLQFIFQHFTSLLHHSVYFTQLLLHFTLSIRFTSHLTSCDLTSPDSSCHTSPYSISSLHTSLCTFKTSLHTLLHFTPYFTSHLTSLHTSHFTSLHSFTPLLSRHTLLLHFTPTSLHTLRHFTPYVTSHSHLTSHLTSLHTSIPLFVSTHFSFLHPSVLHFTSFFTLFFLQHLL